MNSANEKLKYYSDHDLLTGLFNRRFFEHIMLRNKSENENQYTIAIFDIDDFKKVNDTYGHQAGDGRQTLGCQLECATLRLRLKHGNAILYGVSAGIA